MEATIAVHLAINMSAAAPPLQLCLGLATFTAVAFAVQRVRDHSALADTAETAT
jgi:hypothetical protein